MTDIATTPRRSAALSWPRDGSELVSVQAELARAESAPWMRPARRIVVAGCFICFPSGSLGVPGEPAWAGAALLSGRRLVAVRVVSGSAPAAYEPGLLALREGPLLDRAVRELPERPDVLMVNATARDHPRRAGLALHLGAALELPSIGVTDRPLVAEGAGPGQERGAASPLRLEGREVACWLRTRARARPVVVHPGWRVDLETAIPLVLSLTRRTRTPEPLRRARRAAREARAADSVI